jgi:hypothetical protein
VEGFGLFDVDEQVYERLMTIGYQETVKVLEKAAGGQESVMA